ncbi:MAG: hypothetical protein E6R04_06875 [Spirochaetes bacterium]|nr:MAG: hypothetical protein E6R04_06875 [Spirochaetota bacterium]
MRISRTTSQAVSRVLSANRAYFSRAIDRGQITVRQKDARTVLVECPAGTSEFVREYLTQRRYECAMDKNGVWVFGRRYLPALRGGSPAPTNRAQDAPPTKFTVSFDPYRELERRKSGPIFTSEYLALVTPFPHPRDEIRLRGMEREHADLARHLGETWVRVAKKLAVERGVTVRVSRDPNHVNTSTARRFCDEVLGFINVEQGWDTWKVFSHLPSDSKELHASRPSAMLSKIRDRLALGTGRSDR